MTPKWSVKTLAAWKRFGVCYVKSIRTIPVDKLSTEDVLRALRPLWHDKPETADTTRGRIQLVLDHAKARGLRTGDNPAQWKGHLDQILPSHAANTRAHHAAMPFADVPAFLQRLRALEGTAPRALEFTILTASRSSEARGATWMKSTCNRRSGRSRPTA